MDVLAPLKNARIQNMELKSNQLILDAYAEALSRLLHNELILIPISLNVLC